MQLIHTRHSIMNLYYPEISYDWDNDTQTFIWRDDNHPSIEEIDALVVQENNARPAKEARAKRDRLLAESDWVTIRATDTGTPVPTEWQTYRQALRDIPDQTGFPEEIEWPQEPQS